MTNQLVVSSSPHLRGRDSTSGIMLDVIIALIPATVTGCVLFGINAVITVLVAVASAVLFEVLSCLVLKKHQTVGDLSAVVTGLLLALNLPSDLPVWMTAIGSFVAIVVVKQMFGGLGNNFVNPAIAARIVLLASFSTQMMRYPLPLGGHITAQTEATPLASLGFDQNLEIKELLYGVHKGSLGETCAIMLIIGGIYLIIRRVISPIIPVFFVGTVALATFVQKLTEDMGYMDAGKMALRAVLTGGLLLGAIFMATDYVTSPISKIGKVIFGIGCGVVTFIIRYGGNEGVSFAILFMNLLVPHIESITSHKPFGWEGKKK